MNACDHRLGQGDNPHHQRAALGKQGRMAVAGGNAVHFLKVMTSTKSRTVCCKDHTANGRIACDLIQCRVQSRHHRPGKGIAAFGGIQGQGCDRALVFAQDKAGFICVAVGRVSGHLCLPVMARTVCFLLLRQYTVVVEFHVPVLLETKNTTIMILTCGAVPFMGSGK